MKVVILGCSRVGAVLASWLAENKHEVSVIDWEYNSFRRLPKELEIKQVLGIGTDIDILEKSGIAEADAFIAVTNSDNSNLMSAQVVKNKFNIKKVIARVYDANRAKVFAEIGLEILCPTVSSAEYLKEFLVKPEQEKE
jgi:trk system potassium uptake protein TrkA